MASHAAYFIAISAYAVHVRALTIFGTNCTLPEQTYDFVQGPNVRGTIQIVWSCFATLIACTYTVLHLNVPEQRDGRDGGSEKYMLKAMDSDSGYTPLDGAHVSRCASAITAIRNDLRWWWKDNAPSMKWTVITMLAPEYYTCRAFVSLKTAWKNKKALKTLPLSYHPTRGWTLTHAFFADIGGFAIRADTERRPQDIIHLNGDSLFRLLQSDSRFYISPENLPCEQEIQDRSKRDFFAKSLIMLQIGWFVTNCIARLSRDMPTTQLELFTFTTAIWSLISYALLFRKPHSVKTPIVLFSFPGSLPEDIKAILDGDGSTRNSKGIIYQRSLPRDELPAVAWRDSMRMLMYTGAGLTIGCTIFLAYDDGFEYPTEADRHMWRYTIYIMEVFSITVSLTTTALNVYGRRNHAAFAFCEQNVPRIAIVYFITYGLARLFLAIEMVRFLLYLSPDHFLTTWTDNVPHI